MSDFIKNWTDSVDNLVKRKIEYDNKNFLTKLFSNDKLTDDVYSLKIEELFTQKLFKELESCSDYEVTRVVINKFAKHYKSLSYEKNFIIIDKLLQIEHVDEKIRHLLLHLKENLQISQKSFENVYNIIKGK